MSVRTLPPLGLLDLKEIFIFSFSLDVKFSFLYSKKFENVSPISKLLGWNLDFNKTKTIKHFQEYLRYKQCNQWNFFCSKSSSRFFFSATVQLMAVTWKNSVLFHQCVEVSSFSILQWRELKSVGFIYPRQNCQKILEDQTHNFVDPICNALFFQKALILKSVQIVLAACLTSNNFIFNSSATKTAKQPKLLRPGSHSQQHQIQCDLWYQVLDSNSLKLQFLVSSN